MGIKFIKDNKKPLSKSEERYWIHSFNKTLKTGFELEFNLLVKNGMCKGDRPECRCIHINSGCANECLKAEECVTTKAYFNCANYSKKCIDMECKDCENHEYKCDPSTCIEFVSKCLFCENEDKGCDKCEDRYQLKYDPQAVRFKLSNIFEPTKNWGNFGKHGIAEVTRDGSLKGDGGVEITTVGRYTDFFSTYKTLKKIIDTVTDYGAYVNRRTSVHIHILTGHYKHHTKKVEGSPNDIRTNELEREIPQIIFANFWQLCRRYQNALTWMGMGLKDPNHRTRWEKFRISILKYDPLFKNMRTFIAEVINDIANYGRNDYGFFNPINTVVSENGDLRVFHVEFRALDNLACPSILAAFGCLIHAMILKAIEISKYGTMTICDDLLDQLQKTKEKILNNCPNGWDPGPNGRVSTTKINREIQEELITDSLNLLKLVKKHLAKFGNSPFNILRKLALKPLSYYLEEGYSTKEVEKEFEAEIEFPSEESESNPIEEAVQKIIDLREIADCDTLDLWIVKTHELLKQHCLKITRKEFRKLVKSKIRNGEWEWSEHIGSIL